jgi:hypothetical protein
MRLRQNQLCPIHRSRFCCGREAIPMERRPRQMGIRRIEDPHHPRGYRELRSTGEMRKLLNRKIVAQNSKCAICNAEFTEYSDIVPDHISPRGIGGAWRDDHPENIQAVHCGATGKRDRAECELGLADKRSLKHRAPHGSRELRRFHSNQCNHLTTGPLDPESFAPG